MQVWQLVSALRDVYSVGRQAAQELVQRYPDSEVFVDNLSWYDRLVARQS